MASILSQPQCVNHHFKKMQHMIHVGITLCKPSSCYLSVHPHWLFTLPTNFLPPLGDGKVTSQLLPSFLTTVTHWHQVMHKWVRGAFQLVYLQALKYQLISLGTKWPPFRRQYFQMHFHQWNFYILIKISLKFLSKGYDYMACMD